MTTSKKDHELAFVSLGTVVLDELRWPSHPVQYDVPGGSGTFATVGARLLAGRDRAGDVGCIILAGKDYPSRTLAQYESWGLDLVVKTDDTRLSTRGLLEYHDADFGKKTFRYTTPLVRPSPADLPESFLRAASFHLLGQPHEIHSQAEQILALRSNLSIQSRPLLVWEPAPPFCTRETKDAHLEASKLTDVFSPNHLELMAFFYEESPAFDPKIIETCADAFLDAGVGPHGDGSLVVRAGEHGCLVASRTIPGRFRWLPAHDIPVVDATGAGNTFLGAFTFAMAGCGKDAVEAAGMANVAASFALEQIGLPRLVKEAGGDERWNDSLVKERLNAYSATLADSKD